MTLLVALSFLACLFFCVEFSHATCTTHPGSDIRGHDLKPVHGRQLNQCCNICKSTPGCKSFAWNGHLGGTCWLKSATGGRFPKPGVTAGFVGDSSAKCTNHPGKDITGHDIKPVHHKQLHDCCGLCQNTAGCKAFAWNNHRGGTCWLKRSSGSLVSKPGVTAGVVGGGPVDPGNVIKSGVGRHTYYTSYAPCCYDPSADQTECDEFNACEWAGLFACKNGKQSQSWVQNTNIVAFYDDSDPSGSQFKSRWCGKTIRLTKTMKNGSKKTFTATILDTCGNADCNNCCKKNAHNGVLVDFEINTAKRLFGDDLSEAGFGTIEYQVLG